MATLNVADLEPTGAPEEFGFPEHPTAQQVTRWVLQEQWLAAYANCGGIYKAASMAGCSARTFENWHLADLFGFQKRYQAAQRQYLEKMETEADRRALEGVDHPVTHLGIITDTYKQYSDNLLMFRMKKLDPSYRENYNLVMDTTPTRDLLAELRRLGQAKVVEGSLAPGEVPAKVIDTNLLSPTEPPTVEPESSE